MLFLQREPVLRKELGKVRIPLREFTWTLRIWLPSRWVIKRVQNGETEVIPTIVVNAPPSAPLRSRPEADEVRWCVCVCVCVCVCSLSAFQLA